MGDCARLSDARDAVLSDYIACRKKTIGKVKVSYRYLIAALGNVLVSRVTCDDLTRYAAQAMESRSTGTVKGELMCLHRGLNLLFRQGRMKFVPPFPQVKNSDPRQGFFEDADFNRVVDALPEYLRGMVKFLNFTGWRVSEAQGLARASVDWPAQVIRLPTSKNGCGRLFPFAAFPQLEAVLKAQEDRAKLIERVIGRKVEHLFTQNNGCRIRDWRNAWKKACKATGIKRHVHDLRRTAIRRFELARIPRAVAMALSGHKTLSVYLRYSIVDEAAMAEAIGPLASLFPAPESRKENQRQSVSNTQKPQETKAEKSENNLLNFGPILGSMAGVEGNA
jgi:integrase